MNNSSAYQVTLHLTDIRDLFTAPELGPMASAKPIRKKARKIGRVFIFEVWCRFVG